MDQYPRRDHRMYHSSAHSGRARATIAPNRYGYRAREWADQSLGTILTAYREAYGKSLGDVAQDLCLRRVHLRALEGERYQDLPEQSYAAGFVRSYARYLGLPPEEMVSRFREHYRAHSATLEKQTTNRRRQGFAHTATVSYSPRWPSFAVLAIAALLLGLSYSVMAAYTAATNPSPQGRLELEVVSTDQDLEDIDIIFDLPDVSTGPAVAPLDEAGIEIFDLTPTAEDDQILVYGVAVPSLRPESQDPPQPLERADERHRVIIRATGRAHLTLIDHETGEAFLRSEYQRGDAYLVPDGKIVRLLSNDVDRLEIQIDGVSYRLASALAALSDPLVIDPDTIVGSSQLIPL